MNDKFTKWFLVFFITFGIAGFTSVSSAGGEHYFNKEINKMFKAYAKAASKSSKTQQEVLSSCEADLKEIGYQLSSIIVAPTSAGSAGVDARSWTPGEMTEVCTPAVTDAGTEILICVRIQN